MPHLTTSAASFFKITPSENELDASAEFRTEKATNKQIACGSKLF
jgi:hypothetical protein